MTSKCNSVTICPVKYAPKIGNLLTEINKAIAQGKYLDTRHSIKRQSERNITRYEVLQALTSGFHEKRKDVFDLRFKEWNYAIRGKTIDRKDLRIIISFDQANMIIITAIELMKR